MLSRAIFVKRIQIKNGIPGTSMLMHLMGCDLDELNIEKPQEWYTLTKEEKFKLLDIEALDNLQRELICGPHFLNYITEIPDQELLHKAHFLILQSAEDVSNFVIGFKSGVKTRREAYKDDPFILAKHANQIWNEFGLNVNYY
ncbi:hypothetical protein ACJX0J_016459, partial [Zea mays]